MVVTVFYWSIDWLIDWLTIKLIRNLILTFKHSHILIFDFTLLLRMQRLEAVFSHFSAQNNATSTPFASTHRRNETLLQQTPLMDSSMSDRRGRGDARNDFLQRDRGRNLYSGKLDMVPEADPPSQRNAAVARPEKENGFPLRHTQSSPLSPTYGRLKGVEQSSAGLLPNSAAYRNPTAHVEHLLLQGIYEVSFDWLIDCLLARLLIDWLIDWICFDWLIDWLNEVFICFTWRSISDQWPLLCYSQNLSIPNRRKQSIAN